MVFQLHRKNKDQVEFEHADPQEKDNRKVCHEIFFPFAGVFYFRHEILRLNRHLKFPHNLHRDRQFFKPQKEKVSDFKTELMRL